MCQNLMLNKALLLQGLAKNHPAKNGLHKKIIPPKHHHQNNHGLTLLPTRAPSLHNPANRCANFGAHNTPHPRQLTNPRHDPRQRSAASTQLPIPPVRLRHIERRSLPAHPTARRPTAGPGGADEASGRCRRRPPSLQISAARREPEVSRGRARRR